jgi:hypothetical protein
VENRKNWNVALFIRWVSILACLGFGLALAGFAYTGTFTRYEADDYCYNATLNADGFWKAQISFYRDTSDRYSVIPLVGISEVFGLEAIRYWPAVAVFLSVASLTWALKPLSILLNRPLALLDRLLLAEIISFFTFWQAPNLFQVLYWRTGMLTYFMPLVVDILLAGWIAQRAVQPKTSAWALALIGLLAFFAGGFSETTSALQAGGIGLALSAAVLGGRLVAGWKVKSLVPALLAALAGTLIAMVVLFVSPSNDLRMERMPQSASLVVIVTHSLRFGYDFIADTFSSQPLPTGVSLLVVAALGMVNGFKQPGGAGGSRLQPLLILAASGIGMYLLLVCVMAPSVYIQVAYPEFRALIAARWAMTLGLAALGWTAGLSAARWGQAKSRSVLLPLGAALLLGLLSLYSLRAVQVIYAEVPAYRQRAAAWDQRDLEIRQKRAQGEQDITVMAMDSIAGLMELQPGKNQWPNNCTAGMYQVQSITGINP